MLGLLLFEMYTSDLDVNVDGLVSTFANDTKMPNIQWDTDQPQ